MSGMEDDAIGVEWGPTERKRWGGKTAVTQQIIKHMGMDALMRAEEMLLRQFPDSVEPLLCRAVAVYPGGFEHELPKPTLVSVWRFAEEEEARYERALYAPLPRWHRGGRPREISPRPTMYQLYYMGNLEVRRLHFEVPPARFL